MTDVDALSAQTSSELADDLSFALLLALERLSPLERAAFLLHDVFETPFTDIATALGRSEPAVRQLAARARRAVRLAKTQRWAEATTNRPCEAHRRLLDAFLTALASNDADAVKALLCEDVVWISDGGGAAPAFPRPLHGNHRISRILTASGNALSRDRRDWSAVPTTLNGLPGIAILSGGRVQLAMAIAIEEGQIAQLYLLRSSGKLADLARRLSARSQPQVRPSHRCAKDCRCG